MGSSPICMLTLFKGGFKYYKWQKFHKDTRIAGNFRMVQTFAVFADGPTIVKVKTANVKINIKWTVR